MKKYTKKHYQSGFTLIEVLISLILVVMVVTKAMATVSNYQKNSSLASERLQANYLMLAMRDQLQVMSTLAHTNTPDSEDINNWSNFKRKVDSNLHFTLIGNKYKIADYSETINLNNTNFDRCINAEKIGPGGETANWRKIKITVKWSNTHFDSTKTTLDMSYYLYDPLTEPTP